MTAYYFSPDDSLLVNNHSVGSFHIEKALRVLNCSRHLGRVHRFCIVKPQFPDPVRRNVAGR